MPENLIRRWQMIPRFAPQVKTLQLLRAWRARAALPLGLRLDERTPLVEGQQLFALNSGSAALTVLLRALGLPGGAGVGVPVYTCGTVFEAIRSAGLRCVFIDNRPDTFEFDPDSLRGRRAEISAVVMIHMYGYAGDVEAVRQAVPGAAILEDCAHAMGSLDAQGRPVGLAGAGGAFSFNLHKPVSAGAGGLLIVNDTRLVPRVQEQLRAAGPPPRVSPKTLARRILKAGLYHAPLYGLVAGAARRRADLDVDPIGIAAMAPMDRRLAGQGLAVHAEQCRRRRAWAGRLADLAGGLEPVCRFLRAGQRWNGYLWPVLLASRSRRDASLEFFRGRGIDAFVLYRECLGIAAAYGYRRGDCPRLEDALDRLLMLPCHAELSSRQMRRIEKALQEWTRQEGMEGRP